MAQFNQARDDQSGFTLPELLIALVLGLTLVGAIMTAYLTTLKSSGDNNEQAQLNHNLRASLDLILSDLKRAGGLGDENLPATQATLQSLYANNAFMDSVSNLSLRSCNGANECSCVTYSYDEDGDNNPYAGGMNHFGFKLSNTRLQIRTGSSVASGGPHPGCGYDAALNTWESLTEDDVQITQFTVSYIDGDGNVLAEPSAINIPDGNPCVSGDTCIEERNLQVTISGTKDEFSLTVTGKVRVRNDRYFIKP